VSRRRYGAVLLGRHFSLLRPERPDAPKQSGFERSQLLRMGPVEGASSKVRTDLKFRKVRVDFKERVEADSEGGYPGRRGFLAVPSPCIGVRWR